MASMASDGNTSIEASVHANGIPAEACLYSNGELRWRLLGGGGGERLLSIDEEVLGVEVDGRRLVVRAFPHAERKVKKNLVGCGGRRTEGKKEEQTDCQRRIRVDHVLEMASQESATQWEERIKDRIAFLGRPKRLFILLNPFGGKRRAKKIFQDEVVSLLEAAAVFYTVQETEYRLHAQQMAFSLDIEKYDGIVCVSGDGVLVEVINGLLNRNDWDKAIKVPIGIIPAGTGNGMAKSLLHSAGNLCSPSNAAFAVIKGHKRALDVATVLQGNTRFYSVLMVTWGFVADVDIESEKYRWMGTARIDVYTLLRVIKMRKYNGRALFVPATGYEMIGEPVKLNNGSKLDELAHERQNGSSESHPYPGPQTSLDELEWRYLDGPFVAIIINNVPFCNEDTLIAPHAQFSDGYLDVVMLRDCPRSALLWVVLNVANGGYINSSYVTYLKVKAFWLEPGQRIGESRGGIIDSDGEVIARGDYYYSRNSSGREHLMEYGPPIVMAADKGLATMYTP